VALARNIRAAVLRLEREAHAVMRTATPQRAAIARSAGTHASLIRADLALADGQPQQAAKLLEAAAQQHANDPQLQRAVMGRQIVALAGAGDFDRAVEVAQRMMQRFPQDAAAVIDSTLTDLDEQADLLRHRADEALTTRRSTRLDDQARNTAHTASQLARILLDWARSQRLSEDQMLAYRLVHIKALRLAGHVDEAMKLIGPLVAEHRDDAGVIHQAGETRLALGGRDNLISAAKHFDRIIRSYRRPPFPDIWWNAWMRRLEIVVELKENTGDIPLRVRRLRALDPKLGGQRYRNALQLLERQHR
jgi:tetratricopeptide (TPR) repeat protein